MNKSITISIIIAALIIGGAIIFSSPVDEKVTPDAVTTTTTIIATSTDNNILITSSGNVSIENGVQIIELQARGGYSPRQSVAQAGIPTVLRFKTDNTFDCSRSIRISSLNISKVLPQTGTLDVDLGKQNVGLFRGSCGMGMYPFEVDFQ